MRCEFVSTRAQARSRQSGNLFSQLIGSCDGSAPWRPVTTAFAFTYRASSSASSRYGIVAESVTHPGDVNPNEADSEFVTASASWVVAEMLRHAYNTDMESAQALVDSLVKRHSPLVEDIDGFPKLLTPELSVPDRVLVLLNHRRIPTPLADLRKALPTVSGSRLAQILDDLEKSALTHAGNAGYVLTRRGIKSVEAIIRSNGAP